jgi:predicted CoA-binding protein/signal transduction histidine kinase
MYDFLRKVPLFADLPEADLNRLCEMVEQVQLPAGQELFAEGSRGDRAYVIESGELEVIKNSSGRPVLLDLRRAGDVIGEIALLEDTPRTATLRARTDSSLLAINQEQFDQLTNSSPTAARVLLNTVLGRYRNMNVLLRQSEKMAQLGTLTAGVAHELNNPAAAVKRGAGQLDEALAAFAAAQTETARLGLNGDQQALLAELASTVRAAAAKPPAYLDPLARSDQEYEIESWLDEHDVHDAWELAPTLVDLGYDVAGLAGFAGPLAAGQLPVVIRWLGAVYTVYNLLAEVSQGAGRISEIVKSLKSYAYLDQAPVQAVDIHQGLDNTLLILRHKLGSVKVVRDYAPGLPLIQGYGSELNQVWTNLLDNAVDALENTPAPQITLKTEAHDGWVVVEVQDNGPGMPPDVQARVFDAFFTTKPPGKGTGMGLDISYNIVATKHRGNISVVSRPGFTCFQVTLPVDFAAVDSAAAPMVTVDKGDDAQMRRILESARTIAVVGLSSRPERPAHSVPAYMQRKGYRIIPVNPTLEQALGETAYPDLLSVPEPVDVVQIFRRSEDVPPAVEQAIQIGAKAVWMQEGIINEDAADRARRAGLAVVMDTCMRVAHRRLMGAGG